MEHLGKLCYADATASNHADTYMSTDMKHMIAPTH